MKVVHGARALGYVTLKNIFLNWITDQLNQLMAISQLLKEVYQKRPRISK